VKWATERERFLWQFRRRAANYIVQAKPLDTPPAETVKKVLALGPLRGDR
jgi:hypothetical protein